MMDFREARFAVERFVAERLEGRLPDEQIAFVLLGLAVRIAARASMTISSWASVCELSRRTAGDKEEDKP